MADRASTLSDNWFVQFQVFNSTSRAYEYFEFGNKFGFTNWDYSSNIFSSWRYDKDYPNLLAINTQMDNGRTFFINNEYSSSPIEYSGFEALPVGVQSTYTYYIARNETLEIPVLSPSEKQQCFIDRRIMADFAIEGNYFETKFETVDNYGKVFAKLPPWFTGEPNMAYVYAPMEDFRDYRDSWFYFIRVTKTSMITG